VVADGSGFAELACIVHLGGGEDDGSAVEGEVFEFPRDSQDGLFAGIGFGVFDELEMIQKRK